jgi:hypothetical protein
VGLEKEEKGRAKEKDAETLMREEREKYARERMRKEEERRRGGA